MAAWNNEQLTDAATIGVGGSIITAIGFKKQIGAVFNYVWRWWNKHTLQHEQLLKMIVEHTTCRINTARDYEEMKQEIADIKLDAGVARANTAAILTLLEGHGHEPTQ